MEEKTGKAALASMMVTVSDRNPRDPAAAGFVGKRRAVVMAYPDKDGNRSERRAFSRAYKKGKRI